MRWQEPRRGDERCRGPGPGRPARRQWRVLEHGRELLGLFAPDRPCRHQGCTARTHGRASQELEDGRPDGPGKSPRRIGQQGALREGQLLSRTRSRREVELHPWRRNRSWHLRRADCGRWRGSAEPVVPRGDFRPGARRHDLHRHRRRHQPGERYPVWPGGIGLHQQPA
ncbi:hypothetical protein FQZ97_898510 [compost metagenome]